MQNRSAIRDPRVLARTLRIVTGLLLLLFVTTHLLNASFGMISLEAMDAARPYLTEPWNMPLPGTLLGLSLVLHFLLGLWSVYARPSLRTNAQDLVQLVTALCVVPLMAMHVINAIMATQAEIDMTYAQTIRIMWIVNPGIGLLQVIVVTTVWLHGCAGLLTWLRSKEWARNAILWVYPVAIAIPLAALLGFSEAGRSVLEDGQTNAQAGYSYGAQDGYGATDGGYNSGSGQSGYGSTDAYSTGGGYGAPQQQLDMEYMQQVIQGTIWGSIALAALTLLARALRLWMRPKVEVTVTQDAHALPPMRAGLSLLDVFRQNGAPHASLCQGRGRCGTCAVRVLSAEYPLRDPTAFERRTLVRKGLPDDARLACQVIPDGGRISVRSLYPADYTYFDLDEAEEQAETDPTPSGSAA